MTSIGVSIERKTTTFVAQDEKIKPLGDRIFVKPLEWDASKIVIAIREGRPVRGRVLAVGPGAYELKYKYAYRYDKDGKETKERIGVYESDVFVPMSVRVGDIVEFGGLNIFDGNGYSFDSIAWGNDEVLIVTERDIAGVSEAA